MWTKYYSLPHSLANAKAAPRKAMAQDHYIAQTYLKHWAGHEGRLHAYRKSRPHEFQCWPYDVCREWNGDLNPYFKKNPSLLGDFQKIF
jgi:hypothetical protein